MAANGKQKGSTKLGKAVLIMLGAALVLAIIVLGVFTITGLEIEGNEHYSKKELEKLLMSEKFDSNSLYFYWKYKYGEPEEIPFIDTIEVEMLSPHKLKVTVYEKDIVGYVEYLGNCMYFDKDGIVVESSGEVVDGFPLVKGLSFDHMVLHEALPVEDAEVFKIILNLTQLFKKYSIKPDKIYFGDDLQMTLFFDKARVLLGDNENINEKIVRLQSLLPDLEGLEGSLHMEDFGENTENITFEKK